MGLLYLLDTLVISNNSFSWRRQWFFFFIS